MQQLSQRVRALQAQLEAGTCSEAGQAPALAAALRELQHREREKLRLTLTLHALRAPYEHRRFSWQQAGAGGGPPMAAAEQHACDGGCAPRHEPATAEPTQAEHESAVREACVQLQVRPSGAHARQAPRVAAPPPLPPLSPGAGGEIVRACVRTMLCWIQVPACRVPIATGGMQESVVALNDALDEVAQLRSDLRGRCGG
jgi:hypothetical protein